MAPSHNIMLAYPLCNQYFYVILIARGGASRFLIHQTIIDVDLKVKHKLKKIICERWGDKIISKNKKQKYYAIKEGKGVKNKIVRTWSECKELVLGYPSIYKSFSTEEEARKYLNGIKDKDIPVIQDKVKINIQSSKKRRSSTKAISFRVPNEIYNEFIKKVDETGLDKDKILLEMIKEWIE